MARLVRKSEQVEQALIEELSRLETRMQKLATQRDGIRATLIEHRLRRLENKSAIRRNSFSKIIVQKKIIDFISKYKEPVDSQKIYNYINKYNINDPMPPNTFRSYLSRMTQQGLIEKGPNRGTYRPASARAI